MKAPATLLLVAAMALATSCIGPAIATSIKASSHDREAFAKMNTEREAAGLAPLTKSQYMNMQGGEATQTTLPAAPATPSPVYMR
ncbi:MAG: hypothetical protein ACOYMN_13360 [Roseimicrobium sp.]